MTHSNQLIESLRQGAYDNTFAKLYGTDPAIIEKQRLRYLQAVEEFCRIYPESIEDVKLYSAPGRTEIGGNHTDHNHGIVMAAAVNLDIIAVISPTQDRVIRVQSAGFSGMDVVDLSDLNAHETEFGRSSGLIRGVAAGLVKEGGMIGGFNAYTTSDVLRGSGLSSSAAFEVIIGAILNVEYNNTAFTPVQIAQISQYAENVYFGKPSGLMDQTACSVGSAITIDFGNPAQPVVEKVAFDLTAHGYCLCITDTKGSHANLTDDYAAIRQEMENVAACFGKNVLRDVDETLFYQNIAGIRSKVGDRAILRAIHFFADSKRAKELCAAVQKNDFETFLQKIIEGGHSSFEYNQNAYSLKHPAEQGVSLGLALSQKILNGQGAWRLQGGGFAGTIQAFVPLALCKSYCEALSSVFGKDACYVLSVRNYGAVAVTQDL